MISDFGVCFTYRSIVKTYKESIEKNEQDEAETNLTRLFLDLKIPNEYAEKFISEEITKADLIESIDKEQLKELIPKMGPRARYVISICFLVCDFRLN